MNSANNQVSMHKIADVLASVRNKGVRLWSKDGELHFKAPKGALAQEEIECLRTSRGHIISLLERLHGAKGIEPRLEPHPRLNCAPLAFSQLAHWNLYHLSERRSIRQVASATRLHGRLNLDAFRTSVAEIVRRHDALRTRIIVLDGVPIQEIAESGDCDLRVDDLMTVPEGLREAEVIRIIEQHVLDPIDVAVCSLFGARLLRLSDHEHVLIVAMEHIISDAFSLGLLLRDLFATYVQALTGRAFSLPTIPLQFADYAVWQRNAQRSWIEKHGAFWNEHLAGCQRLRFPEDQSVPTATRLGWGAIPLQIGSGLKAELREWCRLRRTTFVMSVFTAFAGLVLRWCNASEGVLQYQSDGRVSTEMENTIGCFTSALYLRVKLFQDDTFIDLMNRLTEEYCKAYEHADFSFMAAQVPRPEFTRNTVFNWIPQGAKIDLSDLDGSENAITYSGVSLVHPILKKLELDREPGIVLYDTDDEVVGGVLFPLNRFSTETMERFGRSFLTFIEALLRHPAGRVKDIVLV